MLVGVALPGAPPFFPLFLFFFLEAAEAAAFEEVTDFGGWFDFSSDP